MEKRILLIDNYDSFTFNLKHYIDQVTQTECVVKRNDEIDVIGAGEYDAFVISPGPGLPEDAGVLIDIIKFYMFKKKMLGVCLGHQALAIAAGNKNLIQLEKVMHGLKRTCIVTDKESALYKNIPERFFAGRYHSWIVNPEVPPGWKVTAVDESGNIMSMEHCEFPLYGVQYHPESVMTEHGLQIIKNWLDV